MSSPTVRSKDLLAKDGWLVAVVERWNPHARIRQDLFGFADLLAMKEGTKPLLIQTTSGSNFSARLSKIIDEERALLALKSGFDIEVHGWRKLKSNKNRWTPRVQRITQADLEV